MTTILFGVGVDACDILTQQVFQQVFVKFVKFRVLGVEFGERTAGKNQSRGIGVSLPANLVIQ